MENIPDLDLKFADPKQKATAHAQELPEELIKQIALKLAELKLDKVDGFLPGVTAYLSEPKQQAIFEGPSKPLKPAQFAQALTSKTLLPSPQTRILTLRKMVYCNGENMSQGQAKDITQAWQTLAAKKVLSNQKLNGIAGSSLYEAYLAGWLVFEIWIQRWI